MPSLPDHITKMLNRVRNLTPQSETYRDVVSRVLLPRSDCRKIVRSELSGQLSNCDFNVVSSRWTKILAPGILGLVEVAELKGGFSVVWGVSLDFVPHLNQSKGFRIEWHKEPKKALLDHSYDPLDYERDMGPWCVDQFNRPDQFSVEAQQLARRVVPLANAYLSPLTSIERVLEAMEAKRSRPYVCHGWMSYPQEILAYAFALARAQRISESRSALAEFESSMRGYDDCRDMSKQPFIELEGLLVPSH